MSLQMMQQFAGGVPMQYPGGFNAPYDQTGAGGYGQQQFGGGGFYQGNSGYGGYSGGGGYGGGYQGGNRGGYQQRGNNNQKYKTSLCRHFQQAGQCSQGDTCSFAHGDHELRGLQDVSTITIFSPNIQGPVPIELDFCLNTINIVS